MAVMGDEYVLGTAVVRAFVDDVRESIASASSPEQACEAVRPRFAELLADPDWLPAQYQAAAPESGMGGGIDDGRRRGGGLAQDGGRRRRIAQGDQPIGGRVGHAAALHGAGAPVPPAGGHRVVVRDGQEGQHARREGALELVERRSLVPGAFYVLIPPRDDIHRVRTTSPETSVSIHLLTNDTGCVWRHSFDPASGEARPFRSGYVNVACEDE